MEIRKFSIPANICTHAHRESIVRFTGIVVAHCFDTAINLRIAFQGVSQEDAKTIILAFHGYAVSTVSFHHRRVNFDAFRFVNGAARMDDESIVRFLQIRMCFIPDGNIRAGRNITVNGYVACNRRKFHVIGCREITVCPHTSAGFQRDVAFSPFSVTYSMKIRADLQHAP